MTTKAPTTKQANAVLDALAGDAAVYDHFNRYLETMGLPAGPTYFAETDPAGCLEALGTFLKGRKLLQDLATNTAEECSGEHDSIEEIIGCDACAKLLDALTDDTEA